MTKILVVEDQQVLASVYRNKFLAEGYQVEIASDGEQGLDLINSGKPDLVLLDLMLPKINGIEVLRKVRANPLFQTLPVIILSNASLPGMVDQAWKAGATMVLSKSNHSPKQIVESVRTALQAASESQSGAVPAATNQPNARSRDDSVSSQSHTNGQVLLVEDHPDMRAVLSLLLDQAGYQVTSVQSHAEAIRETKVREYDLYLLSRLCPDGSGLTLCGQLRQAYPRHPIVIYSTTALPTEQQAALLAGASLYVSKPNELLAIGQLLSPLIKASKTSADFAGPMPPVVSPVAA